PPVLLSNPNANFTLARNPDAPKVRERLERFELLVNARAVPEARAAEGRRLLGRMPKLQADRDLRKLYQELVDGTVTLTALETKRDKIVAGRVLDPKAAEVFERNVLQAAEVVAKRHIKPLTVPELAIRA